MKINVEIRFEHDKDTGEKRAVAVVRFGHDLAEVEVFYDTGESWTEANEKVRKRVEAFLVFLREGVPTTYSYELDYGN